MGSRVEEAWTMAARCAARADTSVDDRMREMLTELRDSWIQVANNLEFTEWATAAARQRGIAPQR